MLKMIKLEIILNLIKLPENAVVVEWEENCTHSVDRNDKVAPDTDIVSDQNNRTRKSRVLLHPTDVAKFKIIRI